jgi:hypothetical protein
MVAWQDQEVAHSEATKAYYFREAQSVPGMHAGLYQCGDNVPMAIERYKGR